jgi:pyruvate dehydrogenase E2 component (dihydrolipoamide acetyltransferase)
MNILMPQLGETVAEGKITKWFKTAGDTVKAGDNLFEIETDKVSMEVPATEAGVLSEIRVAEGEVAPVGAVVGVIGDGSTAHASTPPAPSTPPAKQAPPADKPKAAAPAAAAPATAITARAPIALDPFFEVRTPEHNFGPARLSGGITVTPLARRLASEAGIDLSKIRGSGPHGRIVARDIESAPHAAPAIGGFAEGPNAEQIKALYDPAGYEEVPLDAMRKTIAARLQQAKQLIPHFYLTADVTIDRLTAVREEANAAAPKDRAGQAAFRLSLNDFIIRALALALQRVPAANAAWRTTVFYGSSTPTSAWRSRSMVA